MTQFLTSTTAFRLVRIDPNYVATAVHRGHFPCAPITTVGRSRRFDAGDMIALWLLRELSDDGFKPAEAGAIACEVARAARENPDAQAICYVQDYSGNACAVPADAVPAKDDIRKVTTFPVGRMREAIACVFPLSRREHTGVGGCRSFSALTPGPSPGENFMVSD